MAGSLAPVMYWAVSPTLCSALRSKAGAVAITVSQDALDGAAIEPFEDLRTHAKSFQSPEVLSCPLHDCLGVLGPC